MTDATIADILLQYWQGALFLLFFIWLLIITLVVFRGNALSRKDHCLLKEELGKNSQSLQDSMAALNQSCQDELRGLMKYGDGLEERLAALEDRDLESAAEYSGLLSEVSAMVQRGDSSSRHAFYLRVAEEIVKIQNNLNHMGPEVRGHKQLLKCNERLRDAMLADGYEFVDLLDKPYAEGMKVSATFIQDDNLPPGTQVIRKVVSPQVNYNGQLLQMATVVVAQNAPEPEES